MPPLGPTDVWIFILCLQRMALHLPSSGMLGLASGQLAPIQDNLLHLLPMCNRYGVPSVKTV